MGPWKTCDTPLAHPATAAFLELLDDLIVILRYSGISRILPS